MNASISVDRLSKLYQIGASQSSSYRTLRESVVCGVNSACRRFWERTNSDVVPSNILWALKDVSFEVLPGEVVGVIGQNGSGKSTLLKILSRITQPHSGRITVRGAVGSLLEVGVGFHHELTGRENIFLNGAIFGMTRRAIARKFDEIVAFAEVETFLDTPVKRYSSGMYVRLAFAVAAHLDPDILLVDEVLAVGDTAFQRKCLSKIDTVSRSGRTVLLVSHNMAAILNLCNKVVVLQKGRLVFEGPTQEGVALYSNRSGEKTASDIDLTDHPGRRSGGTRILSRIRLLTGSGHQTQQYFSGEPMLIELHVDHNCRIPNLHFAVGVENLFGARLFTAASYLSESSLPDGSQLRCVLCRVEDLPLCHGRYSITLNAGPIEDRWMDMIDQAASFTVDAGDFYGNGRRAQPDWGPFLVRSEWTRLDS